jgi:hypothetical protein
MRIPIWAFGTAPGTHQRLCRKKLSYCEDLVSRKLLHPVDSTDIRKGCIAAIRGLNFDSNDSHEASLTRAAGWGFDSAWAIMESGHGGPLVWQLQRA